MIQYEDLYDWLPLPWENNEPVWWDTRSAYVVTDIITQADFELEGKLLAHCLGTKNALEWNKVHRMFSIRGPEGLPHATILCVYNGKTSPYGACADLTSSEPFKIDGKKLRVLQVRGRDDDLAAVQFHRIARRFYKAHGGKIRTNDKRLDALCHKYSDNDTAYHFELMWNPRPWERFNFNYQNQLRVEEAKRKGISL